MPAFRRPPSAAIVLATCTLLALAEGAHGDARRLRFSRLSVEDGLAQSSVVGVLQDRLGFLWFATEEGLCRYDGHRFVTRRAGEGPGGLSNSNVTALVEDAHGDLWVGTSLGLHRLDLASGRFQVAGGPAVARLDVRDVAVDSVGTIWFTGAQAGLYALAPGWDAARALAGGALGAAPRVTALTADGPAVWATVDGSLLRVDGAGTVGTPALADLGAVTTLAVQAGRLWIGRRDDALLLFDPARGTVEHFPLAPHDVLALLPAADGTVWIGARDGGLSRLDPRTGALTTERNDPGDPSSLSENDVAALHEDRNGNLWIGTWNGGVDLLDPHAQAFHTLEHRAYDPESLPDNDVLAITETPDGRAWLGSRNGVLAVGAPLDGRFRTIAPAWGAREGWGRVTSLAHDRDAIFVGGERGLVQLDPATATETPLAEPLRRAGLGTRPIDLLAVGPAGDLYVVSGPDVFEAPRATRAPSSRTGVRQLAPVPGGVAAIHVTPRGRLWVASSDGALYALEAGEPRADLRLWQSPTGTFDAGAFVSSLHEDAIGRLWVGSRDGVASLTLSTGEVRWFGRDRSLPSVIVAGLLEGLDGFIWFATNRGLTRIDPASGAAVQFGSRDGAQGSGYAEGACVRGASGLLYFAGHGLTVFDPRQIVVDPHPPSVAFTALEIAHRPVPPRWLDPDSPLAGELHSQGAVTLGPDALVLSFEMAALHFGDPKRNRFEYRLEGFDADWIQTDADRAVATYTRLAAGDYLLRARAVTKNGIWSTRDATLAIHVLPPWWRTPPAIAGWGLLAALATVGAMAAARRRTAVRLALLERETLRRASLTDPLTGLYNRRFLAPYLAHELPAILRVYDSGDTSSELLFLLVDVDHFKSINDRFSHAVGDQMLIAVAQAVRDAIRDSDLAIRWGGDEFLVVSRAVVREHADQCAERLLSSASKIAVPAGGGETVRCTLSIGYAPFPFLRHDPRALTWQQTLELADRALLIAKQRQRNLRVGLTAQANADAAGLLAYLASGPGAPLPPGVDERIE